MSETKLALEGGEPLRRRPFPKWPRNGPEEERALIEVLHSEHWGGYSRKVQELETALARMHGTRYAISCANGTVALEVALRAIGIQCGDQVIVPAITFVATATAVLLCHGVPVFVDIDPESLNLSPAAVDAAVTSRTRAIIAVHFGGRPAEMEALGEIARRHRLALIEDAAHAHGASWRGTPVGNFGAAATFSFQEYKLVTAGEGGAVVTNSEGIARKVWNYCNHGRRQGEGFYEHFSLGSNYRLSGFQAAVISRQLEKLPEETRRRQENMRRLRDGLSSIAGLDTTPEDDRVTANPHYLVTLRYDPGEFAGVDRNLFIRAVQAEGIPVKAPYPYPLYRNPLFRKESLPPCQCGAWKAAQDYESLFLPESERLCETGIWLDHSLFLGSGEDVDDILSGFGKVKRLAQTLARSRPTASPIAR
jgi:dTDP-4-amino-4,6-dideoxygalactose transaminase